MSVLLLTRILFSEMYVRSGSERMHRRSHNRPSGVFLQTEIDDDDEPLIIKLTGTVALLLVETNETN